MSATIDDVIAALAQVAADAYIHEPEVADRWPAVARAVCQAIAVHTGQPVDQILAVLANPQSASGTAPVLMGGAPT